jgi:primosomal protein N' (replication factor Y) (superfamily II helicase)
VTHNFSFFSKKLLFEIAQAIENKKQVILFQNRRGYTPQQSCEICNWVAGCKNCDVKLTYHMQGNVLKCHYCSFTTSPISTCNSCGSSRIKTQGFGTEKIEDELQLHFPRLRIARMDLDSTRSKNAFVNLIEQFEEQSLDVMIGTQMITKGLDFENVHLVGVIDADQMLNAPDFRAHERSFQLMTQVAGRAGRRKVQGKVFIQTAQVNNWVVNAIKDQDFGTFYENELLERDRYMYPPFTKLIEITLKHRDENVLRENALALGDALFETFGGRVLGPDIPLIGRIKNMHLRVIKVKIEKSISQVKTKEIIKEKIQLFLQNARQRSTIISINVDPI